MHDVKVITSKVSKMRSAIVPIRKLITGKMKLALLCLLFLCFLFVTTAATMISSTYYGSEEDGSRVAKRELSAPEHTNLEDVANLETLRLVHVVMNTKNLHVTFTHQ